VDAAVAALVPIGLQTLGGAMAGLAIFALYRYVGRQSRQLGAIMAAGLLLRLTIGLLLFTISYVDLPQLRGVHSSDGFWAVAPDARVYTRRASAAAVEGLDIISDGSASPLYVKTLALWMRGTGAGPASGFFLNVFLYSLLCAVFVYAWKPRDDWRHDVPCILALAGFSFAPGPLFHGTQALKDDLFALLVVAGGAGAFLVLTPVVYGRRETPSAWPASCGLVALAVAIYIIAGIRAYYAILLWASLGVSLALFVLRWDVGRLRRGVPLAAGILAVTGLAWWEGAGVYNVVARLLREPVVATGEAPAGGLRLRAETLATRAANVIARARIGFARSGGGTNLAASQEAERPTAARQQPPAGGSQVAGGKPASPVPSPLAPQAGRSATPPVADPGVPLGTHVSRLLFGLGALLVPISLLQRFSGLEISGGRGLLFLTDADTLFVDATLVATFALVWMRWQTARRHLPYQAFVLVLGCTTALLLAYVVTNFGTLFRLRMLMVVPFWLLLLATSSAWLSPAATLTPRGHDGVSPRGPGDSSG
jgi:hypothetical protein